MSDTTELRVGKKGEIYTTNDVRQKTGIAAGGSVIAAVEGSRLVLEPKPTALDLLRKSRVKAKPLTPRQISELRKELSHGLERR